MRRWPLRSLLAASLLLVTALLPELAAACAVCTAGTGEDSRQAFIWTTVFMSVLPLAAIGAGVLWLRRAMVRAREAERLAEARLSAAGSR